MRAVAADAEDLFVAGRLTVGQFAPSKMVPRSRLHGSIPAAVEVGKVKQRVEFPGVLVMGRILPSPSRSGLISFLAKAPRRSAPELLATDHHLWQQDNRQRAKRG